MDQKTNSQLRTSWLILGVSSVLTLVAGCDIGPITLPGLNQAPTANAGADQTVDVGQRVTLDGLGSTDADDDPLTLSWQQRSGPGVTLADANTVQPSFVPTEDGFYEFALTVTDGRGGSDTSTVRVFVNVDPSTCPRADAGTDQTVSEGAAVMLRGGNSSDPSGDALTFDWFQVSGPQVSISGAFTAEPGFAAPQASGADVVLEFELTVTNEQGCTDTDSVVVTARDRDANDPCDGVVCEDDGQFCNGVERCEEGVGVCGSSGDPCGAGETCDESTNSCAAEPECTTDSDCDDGVFCNGAETCDGGDCVAGTAPCPANETCDEPNELCVAACATDADCDDGVYCNGDEMCVAGECEAGTAPCLPDETCDEATESCLPPDLCEGVTCGAGESCDPGTGVCVSDVTVLRVDGLAAPGGDGSTWATAFDDIHLAIALAINTGGSFEVWVAQGTYTPAGPGGDQSVSFTMINNVELLGGFAGTETTRDQRDIAANETILSGDLDGDDQPSFQNRGDNSFHVLTASSVATTAVLDGFTVQGGSTIATPGFDNDGGGLFITNNGSPIILNCIFRENRTNGANGNGGAISGLRSASRVENVVFANNTASGVGGAVFGAGAAFVDCTFTGNRAADGGGAAWHSGTFTDCMFSNNHADFNGGALSGGNGVGCTFLNNSAGNFGGAANGGSFSNCRFLGNTAQGGGGAAAGVSSVMNCEFSGNHTDASGGALAGASSVANSTFGNNTAGGSNGGAGFAFGGSIGAFANCIFWNNTDESGATESSQVKSGATVFDSIVQGLSVLAGNGNISLNPQFVDPLGPDGIAGTLDDDLRLMSNSPGIDAGDNTSIPVDTLDADGNGDTAEKTPVDLDNTPRIKGGTVDMGAYEAG